MQLAYPIPRYEHSKINALIEEALSSLALSHTMRVSEKSQVLVFIPIFDRSVKTNQYFSIYSYYKLEAQTAPSIHSICPKRLKIANSLTLAKNDRCVQKSANTCI